MNVVHMCYIEQPERDKQHKMKGKLEDEQDIGG
jgi:hypothetical protein